MEFQKLKNVSYYTTRHSWTLPTLTFAKDSRIAFPYVSIILLYGHKSIGLRVYY